MEYEPIIGLEIHAELDTETKMFCRCKNDPFDAEPNTHICPVCVGLPGSLPVMNKKAVEQVILCGMALHCDVASFSKWDRKNYFYPDLPKGYQISQYDLPLTSSGYLNVEDRKIGITRIHLEEDTGKLVHPVGADYSLVDYNRSSVPLMELVTEPELRSGVEAKEFAQKLQLILRSLGISRANMEKGEMRVEVNISLREKRPGVPFGTKVEIKNLNSFRAVERAVNYEIERQKEILESGGKIIQETRGWNEDKGETFSQRAKETAQDYRYFPEPDLPPVEISEDWKKELEKRLVVLPEERLEGYIEKYGLVKEVAQRLATNSKLGDYFDKVMQREDVPAALVANWLIHEDVGKIDPADFTSLVCIIDRKEVSATMGKEILKEMRETGKGPEEIVAAKGLRHISGEEELQQIIEKVVQNNPDAVEDFHKGKEAVVGFLVGQVMKETKGQADPSLARDLVCKELAADK